MKYESIRMKSIAAVALLAVVFSAFVPFCLLSEDADADDAEPDYTFYRYTIKFFSTSTDAEFLVWDFGDGTVLDGRWEYYVEQQEAGEVLSDDIVAGISAYQTLLAANGNSIYCPIHTYAAAGVYTYTITAYNPLGYVSPETNMAYDGVFSTDETGYDGGLLSGSTEMSVCGSTDTAAIVLDVKGYPVITFATNGGSSIEPQTVPNTDVYAPATQPADPVRDGYEFTGWYTDAECTAAWDWNTNVEKDMILYAGWTPDNVLSVWIDGKETTVADGTTVGDLGLAGVPTVEGCAYQWTLFKSNGDLVENFTDDTVLTDGEFLVLACLQDGVSIDDGVIVFILTEEGAPYRLFVIADGQTFGTLFALGFTAPTKEGYILNGWEYVDSDLDDTTVTSTTVLSGQDNFIAPVFAKAVHVYISGTPATYAEGTTFGDLGLETPVKDGYTYLWAGYDSNVSGIALSSDSVLFNGEQICLGCMQNSGSDDGYVNVFVTNGDGIRTHVFALLESGSPTLEDLYDLGLTNPVKEGHLFAGWYNGTTKLIESSLLTDSEQITAKFVKAMTLTVDGTSYTVADGCTFADLGLETPVKEHCTFAGWYNGTTRLSDDDVLTDGMKISAKFTQNTVSVTVDGTSQTLEEGKTAADLTVPVKTGYTFDCWCSDSDLTVSVAGTTPLTEGMTLYAKFVQNTVKITFLKGGDTLAVQTVNQGSSAEKLDGSYAYYSDASCTQEYTFGAVDADTTVYVKDTGSSDSRSKNNCPDWVPYIAILIGAVLAILGMYWFYNPVVAIAGIVLALAGVIDVAGIFEVFKW